MTFINSISFARNCCSYTIRCTGVRPGGSFVNFAISISVCHISSRTSSTASICSMPIHDSVAVSSRCVVSSIRYAISPSISSVVAFNCMVGSHFSSSSIQALYFVSTVSILSVIAFARTITFHIFSSMGPSDSTYMFESSELNSTIVFIMLASSFFHYAAIVVAFQYFLFISSRSCLSAAFSAHTICSLSLNSLVICDCKVFSVSDCSTAKSSYATPSCNPFGAASLHMLIGVTSTNLCQFPSRSMTVLGVVDGIATCGVWLINIFNFVGCVSIVCLRTSCVVVIVVSGSIIVL